VTSPGYPYSYPTNISCYLHVRVPSPCRAELAFCSFRLEGDDHCSYDSLTVFEFSSINSNRRPLGKYCGRTTPNSVVSSTNELLLHFVSDDSETFAGFYAQYRAGKNDAVNS
jgi:cubilin